MNVEHPQAVGEDAPSKHMVRPWKVYWENSAFSVQPGHKYPGTHSDETPLV